MRSAKNLAIRKQLLKCVFYTRKIIVDKIDRHRRVLYQFPNYYNNNQDKSINLYLS
jgi:hypothetical protein